jgi:glycosyltransferase involved in cell wall biosynthesis
MRILWVTPILPSLLSGTSVRQLNLVRLLSSQNDLTILSFLTDQERAHIDRLRSLCSELHTVDVPHWVSPGRWRNRYRILSQVVLDALPDYARIYPVETMRPVLQKLLRQDSFDLVHFVSLYVTQLRSECFHLPTTLTAMDVESVKHRRLYEQETRILHRLKKYLEWLKVRRFERYWIGRYDAVATMSSVDADQLLPWSKGAPLSVVPNGVDTDYFAPPEANARQNQRAVFIGNLEYEPNTQGILYFCEQILPLVRAQVPDFALDIVGPNAPPEVQRLGEDPAISLTGYADVRPYLWRSILSIVPILAGSGTRLKIVEALAAGCPVVSTSVGAEGLSLEHGNDILLADEPHAFAQRVVDLMHSSALQKELSKNGREKVCSEYDWRLIAPKLLDIFRAATESHRCHQLT